MNAKNATTAEEKKKNVLISFLTLDKDDFEHMRHNKPFRLAHWRGNQRAPGEDIVQRNQLWRPAVAMARYHELAQDPLLFDTYYLLHNDTPEAKRILQDVVDDIKAATPEGHTIELKTLKQGFSDPYKYKDVYKWLYELSQRPEFHDPASNYYVNCTSGTYVMRSCLFALTQEGRFPGVRIEPRPWNSRDERDLYTPVGYYEIDKPADLSAIRYDIVTGASARSSQQLANNIKSQNPAFRTLLTRIDQTVRANFNGKPIIDPILFTGATGSGKTTIVEHIAEKRWKKKLYRVNCAELRGDPNIAISRLFGHTKDAYTNCGPAKDGIFKQANGGVLFLDEIGELHPMAQALLLTAIEHRPGKKGYWFTPLGSTEEENSDFQLICGTNRVLEDDPNFRKDLLARISTWHFELPTLAERREDIHNQKEWPLEQFRTDYGAPRAFTASAEELFETFAATWPWQGNFREFNDMIRRIATLSSGETIQPQDVQNEIDLMVAKEEARLRRAGAAAVLNAPAVAAPVEEGAAEKPRPPAGMERLREILGDAFDKVEVKNRILAAYLVEIRESNPAVKSQKELAESAGLSECDVSRWLRASHLAFRRGVILRETDCEPAAKPRPA